MENKNLHSVCVCLSATDDCEGVARGKGNCDLIERKLVIICVEVI